MKSPHTIFDVMYGFVPLTEWEKQIIDSPFYQRLRWIQQLGLASYIFPGAVHTRFSHAIGVMHSMHQMLHALGLAVSDADLHNPQIRSPEALLHRRLRVAALLHDIGTFPFSHSTELGYIRHGSTEKHKRRGAKPLPNSHEHLGSFIIKNTAYNGGITRILEEFELDPAKISKIIKGEAPELIANQLMHADLDADRMDYLMRDAHYTGIKYGQFDRDYILSNLQTYETGSGRLGFGIRENAIAAVDDFLIARYSWYSQVVKNQDSAKFDIMATFLTESFLERGLLTSFHDLLEMIEKRDLRFFWFNDMYFMSRCQEIFREKKIKDPKISECMEMLLFRDAPKTLHCESFSHQNLVGEDSKRPKLIQRVKDRVAEFERCLKKKGTGREWILVDLPERDVVFTKSLKRLKHDRKSDNLYEERDPVKVVSRKGEPSLLVENELSLMKNLSHYSRFIPGVYGNNRAFQLLKSEGLIEG